jgi:hypothetical protein
MPKFLVSVSYTAEGAKGLRLDGGTKRRAPDDDTAHHRGRNGQGGQQEDGLPGTRRLTLKTGRTRVRLSTGP